MTESLIPGRFRLRVAAVILALLTTGIPAPWPSAQDTPLPVPSRIERKNRAPVSAETLRVRLPKPVEAKLANGLTLLLLEDRRLPYISAELHIRGAGALFESPALSGLASTTAAMLREGTRSRTSREIAETLDRLGASAGASASFGSAETVLGASGLSENFDDWFPVAVEMLLHPTFPEVELSRLKDRLRVQLRQQRGTGRFLMNERFHSAVFGKHPAARISATPESIKALTPKLLAEWHRERYVPNRSILAIAGDFAPAELIGKLHNWLAGWRPPATNSAPVPPAAEPVPVRKVYLVDRPDAVQTNLTIGNIALDRRSDDFVPMVVLNQLLGGGPASRLFLNLREEKGYTYGAYSGFTALEYAGPWQASADVRTEVTEGALVELLGELRRIAETSVGETELEASKRAVVARFALALEQPSRLLGFALTRKFYSFPEDYWDRYPAMIAAVTPDDIQRVARRYLKPETMQIVAVGDRKRIQPVLEKFGPLEIYDVNGNVVR